MTADDLVRRLGKALTTIRAQRELLIRREAEYAECRSDRVELLAENKRLRRRVRDLNDSRDYWRERGAAVANIRRDLARARRSRDLWKQRVPPRRHTDPHPHGVILSQQDLDRILAMPVRKR